MYLHAGNSKNIRISDIIGIFDADTATVSAVTRRFLTDAQANGTLESANGELPKSMIVYSDRGVIRVCFSQLSTQALSGRLDSLANM